MRGNNTTISIAHRLSTIQRSDMIICIGSDGRVAEIGTYTELANKPEGAFNKLMEWQMNGGEQPRRGPQSPHVTEEEELAYHAQETGHTGEDVIDEEGTKARKENVTASEVVIERVDSKT